MADESSGAHRDPDEIRREIARTRAEMDDTVDELGERLSPGRLVDDVWARFRRAGGLSAIGETVRDHPVPVALMGLGLAWLAIEQASGRSTAERVGPGTGRISDARERLSHAVHDKADELMMRVLAGDQRAVQRPHAAQVSAPACVRDDLHHRSERRSRNIGQRRRGRAEHKQRRDLAPHRPQHAQAAPHQTTRRPNLVGQLRRP